MRPCARRSISEHDTWFDTSGTPLARAMRKCAVSKLVTPIAPMSPSTRRSARCPSASSHDESLNRHAWNCSSSTRSVRNRDRERTTAVRVASALTPPGAGTHLVRNCAAVALAPRDARKRPAISSADP